MSFSFGRRMFAFVRAKWMFRITSGCQHLNRSGFMSTILTEIVFHEILHVSSRLRLTGFGISGCIRKEDTTLFSSSLRSGSGILIFVFLCFEIFDCYTITKLRNIRETDNMIYNRFTGCIITVSAKCKDSFRVSLL